MTNEGTTLYCGDNCNHTGPHVYPPTTTIKRHAHGCRAILAIEAEARAAEPPALDTRRVLADLHNEATDDPQQSGQYWDGWHAALDAAEREIGHGRLTWHGTTAEPPALDVGRLRKALTAGGYYVVSGQTLEDAVAEYARLAREGSDGA